MSIFVHNRPSCPYCPSPIHENSFFTQQYVVATNPKIHIPEEGRARNSKASLAAPVLPNEGASSPAKSQKREYPNDPNPRNKAVKNINPTAGEQSARNIIMARDVVPKPLACRCERLKYVHDLDNTFPALAISPSYCSSTTLAAFSFKWSLRLSSNAPNTPPRPKPYNSVIKESSNPIRITFND